MTEDLGNQAARALQAALDAGAEDAVVALGVSRNTEFSFRDGRLEHVERSIGRGLGLQLYVEGRYSTHQTSDLRPEALRRFLDQAVQLTAHLALDPARAIPDPRLYEGRASVDLQLYDPAVPALDRERCLQWLEEMDAIAHEEARVVSATSSVETSEHRSVRLSSNGFHGEQSSTVVAWGTEVTLDEGNGRRPGGHRGVRSRHLADLPAPAQVAREALERARRRLGSTKAPSARTFMVVDPEAGGALLGRLGDALTAAAIQQNRSCLADKLGQTIASPVLSLTDDPLIPRGLGSRLFDGEGIAARTRPVVQDGVLRTYYVDTYYGRKLGWAPTTGGPSNVIFRLGDKGLEALVAEVGSGFYVDGWIGGNADMTTGDLSFGIRGHRIEQGRIGAPVSEMNITGNYLELLARLTAVGDDPTPYSSLATPTLVFAEVDFSGG